MKAFFSKLGWIDYRSKVRWKVVVADLIVVAAYSYLFVLAYSINGGVK